MGVETRAVVVGLSDADAQRTAVIRATTRTGGGETCSDVSRFLLVVQSVAPSCVVLGTTDPRGESTALLVGRLVRDRPRVGIVAVCDTTPASIQALVHLARAGVDEVLLTSMATRSEWSATIDRACARRRAMSDWQLISPYVPEEFHALFRYCFADSLARRSVRELADTLDIDRSTLASRLRAAGLPPAKTLLSWSRLMAVTALAQDAGTTIESTAHRAGFPSASRLRAFTRRMVGVGPRALAELGIEYVHERFVRSLANQRAASADVPRRFRGK